jgi:hypothetical protein
MRILISIFLFFIFSKSVFAQQKFTINGYIKDSLSGETLIGANLAAKAEGRGVSSNLYGFYSLTLKKGKYNLLCSFVGYESKEIEIDLNANKELSIALLPYKATMKEVVEIGRASCRERVSTWV